MKWGIFLLKTSEGELNLCCEFNGNLKNKKGTNGRFFEKKCFEII